MGSTALSPGGIHRSVPRVGFTARPAAAGPWVGLTARLVAAGPRLDYTVRSPGWAAPPAGRCRSPVGLYRSVPGWAAPPAGRCRSTVGLYHSVPRVGRTARLAATDPRMGRTASRSLPVPGWAITLGPPGGPHRPADRCWSLGGFHRPAGRCRSPGWAASPGWPLLVPGWDAYPGWPLTVPVGLYRSVSRVFRTARLAAAGPE